ncbi:MAG: N-acetylmannosamine-6-phosphate 2-epimerase [Candidatus Gastranaerophilales bacterium]|nr:N-acetylmannosamine-6-phosphate 2-epimerase [Candidatus Gastranaerophilales bacterium]
MINGLKNKVIVSVQAMPDEPLYEEDCMFAMMRSVVNGGAAALRVAGARDVKNAKKLNVPVIGLTKPESLPDNWKGIVYITPTLKEVNSLIDSDADIIAFDGTSRPRPGGCLLSDIILRIKQAGKLAMADIAALDEGLFCAESGVDIISTTLSGYTSETLSDSTEPDYELLKELVERTSVPVILEGRIWKPEQVNKAFELGAHSVVIGSAITRPQLITKKFVER